MLYVKICYKYKYVISICYINMYMHKCILIYVIYLSVRVCLCARVEIAPEQNLTHKTIRGMIL